MRRRFHLRHALAIEDEYRRRLQRRVRTIAAAHRENTRTDGILAPMGLTALLAVAVAVSRFIGRQVDAHLAAIGRRPQTRAAPAEGMRAVSVPSANEVASYTTWAEWEQRAIAEHEVLLEQELLERPDALERALVRARLIADRGVTWQTGVTVEWRSKAVGCHSYRWNTVGDERVRIAHVELDETIQRWDDPPIAEANGDRYHCGQRNGCRCTAEPIGDVEIEPL